jgi:kynurenine formamidase
MYDLTQPLTPDVPRFPGDPAVRIEPIHDFAPWRISTLAMGSHSGTHMDAPLHRIPGGAGIGAYGPDRLIGEGLVIDAADRAENEPISESVLDQIRQHVWPGWFAIVRTGWDRHWGEERYFRHPFLSPALARTLVELGAAIVAIDALSIDSTVDAGAEAHEILLGADVLAAENLRGLDVLTPSQLHTFAFLPLALRQVDGSPARVVAWDASPRR